MIEMKMVFCLALNQCVDINVSNEWGIVKGRADYTTSDNCYLIHYKAADGKATSAWFDESDLTAAEDDKYPGCRVFSVSKADLPDTAHLNN